MHRVPRSKHRVHLPNGLSGPDSRGAVRPPPTTNHEARRHVLVMARIPRLPLCRLAEPPSAPRGPFVPGAMRQSTRLIRRRARRPCRRSPPSPLCMALLRVQRPGPGQHRHGGQSSSSFRLLGWPSCPRRAVASPLRPASPRPGSRRRAPAGPGHVGRPRQGCRRHLPVRAGWSAPGRRTTRVSRRRASATAVWMTLGAAILRRPVPASSPSNRHWQRLPLPPFIGDHLPPPPGVPSVR